MSKRQVIVLWIIALVLTGSLIAVKTSSGKGFEDATKRARGETLLEDFKKEADQVAKVSITQGDKSVVLEKKDGAWKVANRDDYPANGTNVYELLRTVADAEVTQGIGLTEDRDLESIAPRFGMDPDVGEDGEPPTELVLSNDAGTEVARLTFGKNLESGSSGMSPFGGGSTGRFVRNHADPSGVYVTKELFSSLTADPTRWLDTKFIQVEKIQSIRVTKPGEPDSTEWTVTRPDENAEFTLEGKKDNEQLDTTALNPLKSLFSYARFEDVVPAAEAAEAWNAERKRTAIIETFEGFTYTIHFGPEKSKEPAEGDGAEAGAGAEETSYLMTVEVSANIPSERKKEEGESDEDAKSKQEAFDKRKAELEEKLATTRKLEGRTFKVTKYTVDALLKNRTGLIKAAPPAATTPPVGMTPPAGGPLAPAPGGAVPNRPRVQAVTPPIAIPPLPQGGDTEDESGDE